MKLNAAALSVTKGEKTGHRDKQTGQFGGIHHLQLSEGSMLPCQKADD
jgi:hypothetical protein